jgi:small subunit ribosomal protein S6
LKRADSYGRIGNCDVLLNYQRTQFSLFPEEPGARDHKEVQNMNKYELAVVVSAKIEDDARAAVVEKAKDYITRLGGTITNVDEWGKKRLAYEIQKMREGYYYFIQFDASAECPAEIERRVRIMEPVMRYLCVKQDA